MIIIIIIIIKMIIIIIIIIVIIILIIIIIIIVIIVILIIIIIVIIIIIIILIIIIIAWGDSSVGRLLCVFLIERFAIRISPLAFLRMHLICAVRKNALARLYWVFLNLPDRCV